MWTIDYSNGLEKKNMIGSQMGLAMGKQTYLSLNYFIGSRKINNNKKIYWVLNCALSWLKNNLETQ